MLKKSLILSTMIAGLATGAQAEWYAGAEAGFGAIYGKTTFEAADLAKVLQTKTSASYGAQSPSFGLFAGYHHHCKNDLTIGVEASGSYAPATSTSTGRMDIDAAALTAFGLAGGPVPALINTLVGEDIKVTLKRNWRSSVAFRLGRTFHEENVHLYGKLGLALNMYQSRESKVSGHSKDFMMPSFTTGIGAEIRLASDWKVRVEANWDIATCTKTYTQSVQTAPVTLKIKQPSSFGVNIGVSYSFN